MLPSAAAAAEGVRGRVRPLVSPVMDLRMLLMATTTLSRAIAEEPVGWGEAGDWMEPLSPLSLLLSVGPRSKTAVKVGDCMT